MALALLNLAISCTVLLYYAGNLIPLVLINYLRMSSFIFLGLSAFFYWSYQLNKNKDGQRG